MNKRKSKKKKLTFSKFLSIFLVIVSLLVIALVYFIGILPFDYFLVLCGLIVLEDIINLYLLLAKGTIRNVIGMLLSIFIIIVMILGINNVLNTIDFFKQFGFNSYKTETYNVVVLKEDEYKLKDLKGQVIGHLDIKKSKGLEEVLKNLRKKIEFKDKVLEDVLDLTDCLISNKCKAVVLQESQLEIISEENNDIFNKLKVIDSLESEIKIEQVGSSVDVTEDSFNVYLSGIDTYGSITKVARSDVNIVMSVNPKSGKILLTSIPRDYYVKLHTYEEYDKLTHAGIYGIEESVKTIEDLLDVKINYYVKVNFTTLVNIVDALGGVDIESKYNFTSEDGYIYKKGINHLSGKEALSFARERHSFKDGDRVRGENQELLLTAIIDKATSPKIITNYNNLLGAIKGKFITNISDDDITKFIKKQLDDPIKWNIESIALNGKDSMNYTYSYKKNKLYVMEPDVDTINNAKEKILNTIK